MKKIVFLILFAIALNAQPATKEDIKELKQDIKLLINKVNDIDKKVYANSIKIDMLEKNMNKRFELINKRFEDINKRFEDMLNYLWMISAAFLGLVAVTIGFAIWDRRSMIKAAKEEIVEEIKNEKLKEFIYELQKLAKRDREVANILRSFHML
jgi:hypothetical protein